MGNISHTTGSVSIGTSTTVANTPLLVQGGGDGISTIRLQIAGVGGLNYGSLVIGGPQATTVVESKWKNSFVLEGVPLADATGASGSTIISSFVRDLQFHTGDRIERMRIKADGKIGINTASPSASLDVNGTLKVGDFGGATNVTVKPINTTPGEVGHVQPIFFGSSRYSDSGNSRGIPAGTWFVWGEWVENTNDTNDNDPTIFMAKIWTVPTGKYLHIATDSGLWTESEGVAGGRINLHWKISDNAVENISGIASVADWGTGWNTFVIPPNNNPSATTAVGGRTVTASSGYNAGYGAYNTYGVVGFPNNTALGSGYGYIQRLS